MPTPKLIRIITVHGCKCPVDKLKVAAQVRNNNSVEGLLQYFGLPMEGLFCPFLRVDICWWPYHYFSSKVQGVSMEKSFFSEAQS